jgi:hypothetical protein
MKEQEAQREKAMKAPISQPSKKKAKAKAKKNPLPRG